MHRVILQSGAQREPLGNNFDHLPTPPKGNVKKRKVDRACDACRRKKTKCDGPKKSDNVCSNCLEMHKPCTYLEASKPRGPPKAYVTGLEDRLEKMEMLLRRLQPGMDFSNELGPPVVRNSWKTEETSGSSRGQTAFSSQHPSPSALTKKISSSSMQSGPSIHADELRKSPTLRPSTHLTFNAPPRFHLVETIPAPPNSFTAHRPVKEEDTDYDSASPMTSSAESDDEVTYDGGLTRLTLRGTEQQSTESESYVRFHGKSSDGSLIGAIRKFKEMFVIESSEPESSDERPPHSKSGTPARAAFLPNNSTRRPQFWQTPAWELRWEGIHEDSPELLPSILTKWPPADLANNLINLYFDQIHPQCPLLHQPTFRRQWEKNKWRDDLWFACVCFSIFAVASRWSDDPRVLQPDLKEESQKLNWAKAGWDFFEVALGIHRVRRSLICPVTLFELQTFTLLSMFLRGADTHAAAWVIGNIGLSKAHDVGAHRKAVYKREPSVNEELWKRAFWCLVLYNRLGGASLGRGCSLKEEDFDLDMPLEVDDEYWEPEDPRMAFKQPPEKCSTITAFNLHLRLSQIIGLCLNTLYSPKLPQVFEYVPGKWRDEIIVQLEQALKDWLDAVPEHLKWSDNIKDPAFSNQSASLYVAYHNARMLVHRIVIPQRGHEKAAIALCSFSSTALAVCTESARICSSIIRAQMRKGASNLIHMAHVAFISITILTVKLWDLKAEQRQRMSMEEDVKPPLVHTIEHLSSDIDGLVDVLKWIEPRWPIVSTYVQYVRRMLPDPPCAPPEYPSDGYSAQCSTAGNAVTDGDGTEPRIQAVDSLQVEWQPSQSTSSCDSEESFLFPVTPTHRGNLRGPPTEGNGQRIVQAELFPAQSCAANEWSPARAMASSASTSTLATVDDMYRNVAPRRSSTADLSRWSDHDMYSQRRGTQNADLRPSRSWAFKQNDGLVVHHGNGNISPTSSSYNTSPTEYILFPGSDDGKPNINGEWSNQCFPEGVPPPWPLTREGQANPPLPSMIAGHPPPDDCAHEFMYTTAYIH